MKDGWKTSEFWIMIAGLVLSALTVFGFLSRDEADTLQPVIAEIIVAIFALLAFFGLPVQYMRVRTQVKVASLNLQAANVQAYNNASE